MFRLTVAEACDGALPFSLCAKAIGFFPNERSPRVVWVGVEENQNHLSNLQTRIAESLAPFVKKLDTEKFHAHVTLGRFQKFRRHKTEKLLPHAWSLKELIFGGWRVNSVDLMRSELSSGGAIHSGLLSMPLK
jgi:2'-5' RNA ligase